jgi:uncharacterized protein
LTDSKFADRLRHVLQTPGRQRAPAGDRAEREFPDRLEDGFNVPTAAAEAPGALEQALGGRWRRGAGAPCFVVETRWDAPSTHGSDALGTIAGRLQECEEEAPLLAGSPAGSPMLFLDLETTGLSGGAGTLAFLVGCAWAERGGFVTRQYLLPRFADERSVLASVADELAGAGALVTFNGKSFDAPVLETRYLFHRLEWAGGHLPHIDMLHVARRFWRRDVNGSAECPSDDAGCSLAALERQVLGAPRRGDVPSFEIPSRYFHFVRTGDARPLARVFEHNRLDLLSLAALTSRVLHLVRRGAESAKHPREALALGRVYARAGLGDRERAAYERAIELCGRTTDSEVYMDAVRALALALRRSRKYQEAAGCWEQLLGLHHCPPRLAREASEALAIHHEHRVRDFPAAKAFALRGLEQHSGPAWKNAAQYRLTRLERKMAAHPILF